MWRTGVLRKVILTLFLLLALFVVAAWAASYWRPLRARGVYHPFGSPHSVRLYVKQGRVLVWYHEVPGAQATRAPPTRLPRAAARNYFEYGFASTNHTRRMRDSFRFHWRSPLGYGSLRRTLVGFPVWMLAALFISYPATSIVCSLVRRHRRSRHGLCTRCAYDLTGNTSGTCPECGTKISPSE